MDWIPVMAAISDATTEPVTTQGLGALCTVANNLPSNEEQIRQDIYKIVCAGLVAIGDNVNFEKLYNRILDTNSGCDYVTKCYRCNGSGHAENSCSVCGGSGVCPACHGQGGSVRQGLAGASNVVMPCGKCGRSGKCSRCRGSGRISEKCNDCGGKGKSVSQNRAKGTYIRLKEDLINSLEKKTMTAKGLVQYGDEWISPEEKETREKEAKGLILYEGEWMTPREKENREMAAKGLVRYGDEWVTPEERERRLEKEREEREKREERQREVVERMRDMGLVNIRGKWMTPDSLRDVQFHVFQIYESGHALCRFVGTDIIFCLLFSAENNRNVAEGDYFTNDLYRCGTYSYTTVQGAPSTVRMYAIDLEVAIKEIKKHH